MNTQEKLAIQTSSIDSNIYQRVKSLIVRDLFNLNWDLQQRDKTLIIAPPKEYSKEIVMKSMEYKRREIFASAQSWIEKNRKLLHNNLATGSQAFNSQIIPTIEVCTSQKQHDIFRMCRYYWSSPYSDYVGRRIKLLIRDDALANRPIIGIAALGSPIIHIPERDDWVGWNKETRTNNLILCMDAYVLGAMPPYNMLLGGKLIAYMLASNEIRQLYKRKYDGRLTSISSRMSSDLVCLFTTSLYGRSSQYNRISYDNKYLYNEIGKTKGFGSLHLTDETFSAMQELLRGAGLIITNRFGDGPNWRMRVIRTACDYIGIDADTLLRHSFRRNIYATPLAENYRDILLGNETVPTYYDYPVDSLVNYWKERWLYKRKIYLRESNRLNEILSFHPQSFSIE